MLENFIKNRIIARLAFVPNTGQREALEHLGIFLSRSEERPCFLLTGYAGTGKTSLVSALTRAMNELGQPCMLLAPTGRAAKVMSHYSGFPAYTIHKWIYSVNRVPPGTPIEGESGNRGVGESVNWELRFNRDKNVLFIADEASMIDKTLLTDLIQFVFQGENCRLLLLGDEAQLPPVEYKDSPALQVAELEAFGLSVRHCRLTEVARQAEQSGILKNATYIRSLIDHPASDTGEAVPKLIHEAADVFLMPGHQMVEEIDRSYREAGVEETLIITRSNKRTNLYNQGVRAQLLWKEDILQAGDRVMVSRNNYFFTQQYENLPFLANGDMLEIVRLRNEREMYGYRFIDAQLRSLDYEWEIDAVLWLDTLLTDSPETSYRLQRELYAKIAEDYPEIRSKKELKEKITASPYYNALQIRYGYAVTCHKAQGGQWKNVFIDAGALTDKTNDDGERKEDLRWMYTALTRATEKIYLLKK